MDRKRIYNPAPNPTPGPQQPARWRFTDFASI